MGNFDGGWKLAVTRFFPLFMNLLFRGAYDQIDWKRGFVSLDKELEAVFPKGKSGRKHVDLLFKVWLNDGSQQWVLIHIEIQSQRVEDFEQVMYEYNYRVYDRYKRPVASFAVLADEHPSWRPSRFERNVLGCKQTLEFPTAKLLDFGDASLESQNNPVAILILAHRRAHETRERPGDRKLSKLKLVRSLFEGGLSREDVQEMFRIINWMMDLPEKLELELRHDIEHIEKEKQVTYLSSMDRAVMALAAKEGRKKGLREGVRKGVRKGLREGVRKGVQKGLREGRVGGLLEAISIAADAKFGSAAGKSLIARLETSGIDVLKKAQLAVATATSIEQLNQLLRPIFTRPAPARRTNRK
jgi:hypothetical protein